MSGLLISGVCLVRCFGAYVPIFEVFAPMKEWVVCAAEAEMKMTPSTSFGLDLLRKKVPLCHRHYYRSFLTMLPASAT